MELMTKFVESFSSEPLIRKYSYLDHSWKVGIHILTPINPRVPAPVGGVGGSKSRTPLKSTTKYWLRTCVWI